MNKRLFPFSRAKLETWLPRLREWNQRYLGIPRLRVWGVLAFLVTLVSLIIERDAIVAIFRPPPTMTGDFRVAVAAFVVEGDRDMETYGEELANGVYLNLEEGYAELSPDFTVTVWGPDQVGQAEGATRDDRAQAAADIAKELRADIVVYGLVDARQTIWTVVPEFYVNDRNLLDAQELIGQHELGRPFEATGQGSIATRIDVSTRLGIRARFLSQLTIGLAYYAAGNYGQAQIEFAALESAFNWSEVGGRELLYLMLGNAAAKNNALNVAENAYLTALSANSDYSRAYIGLGSVYYLRALLPAERVDNPAAIDTGLMQKAIATYEQAAVAPLRPALADVETKVHLGLGQAYLMLALQDSSQPFDRAIEELEAVVDDYGDGANPRVRELAGEAHARLGLIYRIDNQVERAIDEYEQALVLLDGRPERLQEFEQVLRELRGGAWGGTRSEAQPARVAPGGCDEEVPACCSHRTADHLLWRVARRRAKQ